MMYAQKGVSELEVKMERKSWSWKKKVLEKLASSRINTDSSEDYSKHCTDDLIRTQFIFKEQVSTPDGISQAEMKLRILGEQLMARDELVQQHAKVAEEAVTGWEKAECEAACLKQQLDEEMLCKVATEEQLVRLETALKDSMGKLQHAEERELRLQRVVEAKNQELDNLRGEMESTLSKIVNEMTRAAKEADAKSRAEDKASVLQKRVDMAEKEQANLKYEIHVLTKELDIRNEELELNKQAAEAANKQHLEYVKRAAKLDDDCQRLRLLLRKRLPGPATIAQMRMEVDALPTFDRAGRTLSSPSSRFTELYMESALSDASQELENRLLAAEEENKSLKEALVKKDGDLQSARILCAKTASKLSATQEQLEKATERRPQNIFHRSTKSAMDGYTSLVEQALRFDPEDESIENESNCAESWASALISELAQIRKDKGGALHLSGPDLMDDFVEMEKLALLPFESHDKVLGEELVKGQRLQAYDIAKGFKDIVGDKLTSHDCSCHELRSKLTCAENELNLVKLDNSATKAALSSIEKHLVALLQAETEERTPSDLFEELRAALDSMYKHLTDSNGPSYALCNGMDSPEVRDATAWSPIGQSSCQSEDAASFKQDIKSSTKKGHLGSKLCSAVHKVVSLFEEVAQLDWKEDPSSDTGDTLARIHTEKLWRSPEFESCVSSLIMLCTGVLNEKVDVKDFLEEIASALEWLVNHVYASSDKSLETRRRLEFGKVKQESLSGPEQVPLEEECANDRNKRNQCIEKQLTQLKSEKEEIDTKLSVMTKELELLKSLLQNSEHNGLELQNIPAAALDGQKNLVGIDIAGNVRSDSYQPSGTAGVKRSVQTIGSQKVLLNEMTPRSFQPQKARSTMVLETNEISMPMEKGTEMLAKEQELGGYAEKLAECQHTIMMLGKQLQGLGTPDDVSAASQQKSEHILIKPFKAQRRTQRSFDQLQTISEDNSVCEDTHRNIGQMSPEMSLSCASVSADPHKHSFFEPSQRDLVMASLVRSPGRFLRSKGDIKADSSPEKHTTGLSRFFSKSKLLNDTRP